jgi:hypothetical protein
MDGMHAHHSVPSTSKTTPCSFGAPESLAPCLKGANTLAFGVDCAIMDINLFISAMNMPLICHLRFIRYAYSVSPPAATVVPGIS